MAQENFLSKKIGFLKGVGPAKEALLQKELKIFTFGDLLLHFPFRYIDRTQVYKISDLNTDLPFIQLSGIVKNIRIQGQKRGMRLTAKLEDSSGTIELVWFQKIRWVQEYLKEGQRYLVFGRPSQFNNRWNIVHPEMDLLSEPKPQPGKSLNLQPVYNTTEKLRARGLDSKGLEKLQKTLVADAIPYIQENLPSAMLEKYKLMPRQEAFRQIHFPEDADKMERSRSRLKFEELFYVQLQLLRSKQLRQQNFPGQILKKVGSYFSRFYEELLPFQLTGAQKRVLKEIRADVKSGRQMNRLLQGDVGSGKTIVAFMSMLIAIDNCKQAALIAPTEILASQHYNTLTAMSTGLNLTIKLLTGSTPAAERKELHKALQAGEVNVLAGTHALLQETVRFKDLALVVIDEQHRFGVAQRAAMWTKNEVPPHVLVMTATPIPRTLAMTFYGDLDTSVIDELPPGRKEIITRHITEGKRLRLLNFLKQKIKEGRQVYIVYPLIEESEKMDYANLMDGYEMIIREFPRPEYQVSIVHGRQKSAEKEFEMQRFKKGETQIMVATTVIEVGVDVPNATVMVIENAERFGLSQLHQLRGRVGRGAEQSYCFLASGYKLSRESRLRLDTMVRTNNGFEIAETDLQLRGPGDMAGTKQSGMMDFRVADLAKDQKILQLARHTALQIMETDPALEAPAHQVLHRYLKRQEKDQFNWSLIS
ncbi:MAG: ATP-dependent DNA helicase RecG [Bacteroidia bacterium]